MEDTIKKFKFKAPGIVLNAPKYIEKEFVLQGFHTQWENTTSMNSVVFIQDQQALLFFLQTELIRIVPDSVLWLAYPKGTSKMKTDINRDSIRTIAEDFGITTVSAISIDETWSALRFRPIEKVGK